ncbi:uracil-DNA glycosylase [Alphaproteobacteria bacterium GH1-50]|uniref:Uracil-DNA glycosylase n=1 Tax=Kangsaoukella pontilimi TaxID=2691042 RepID=A0A7C9ME93_9RHOB|nr:uracil-DNA glycosylase [Kangsaoukella pontilimi]MXQ06876.1 uracil-DNA glycosylase [Kangsaoukella pontilimi]
MTDDLARLGPWRDLPFFHLVWPDLRGLVGEDALPPAPMRFRALEMTPPDAVRVLILGQDPYPTPGHANGLAFSVTADTPLPRSLTNIFREMEDDLGHRPGTGDLSGWADQGVLLLNTALSTPPGQAGGHARLGWQRLAEEVLDRLNDRPRAALLWGNHARAFAPRLSHPDHLILESAHPSPLSARRGFFGSRPFSRINDWLAARGEAPIDWTATET